MLRESQNSIIIGCMKGAGRALAITSKVNGELRQSSNTGMLRNGVNGAGTIEVPIFSVLEKRVEKIISHTIKHPQYGLVVL